MMLDTLREAFPNASIPKSLYEMKKIIKGLGLSYERIDACPNECMLYRNENSKKIECDICHISRYQQRENEPEDKSTTSHKHKKIAAKVLRYFPLQPRLQRLYMSSKTAVSMRWHEESRTKDGCLRHPADSPAWKTFDFQYPDFAKEPRNVRLGLATDGFNPFRTMSVSHSTWPVVLMPYNLPPWMCMKQPYFMISLLIPGPSAPGNNIDVYYDDGGCRGVVPLFLMSGRFVGAVETQTLDLETLAKAHSYVMFNCNKVDEFITEHMKIVRDQNQRLREHELQRIHGKTFALWFQNHVEELHTLGDQRITEELRALASGPIEIVKKYKGFIINGFRFHTQELERKRKTQNSGVVLDVRTNSFSSVRDNNPITGDVTYYGVLRDIIELEYSIAKKVVLFDCDWISTGKRKREDENGFTLLNFKGLKPHNEPFILACQAQQVFYIADPVDKDWPVMIKTTARDFYDMNEQPCLDDVDTYLQSESFSRPQVDENMDIDLTREGFSGIIIDKDIPILDGDEDQFVALS